MINRSHVKCFIIEENQIKKTDLGAFSVKTTEIFFFQPCVIFTDFSVSAKFL